VDNNRQKVWIAVAGLLFLVSVVGAFLLGRSTNPPSTQPTPIPSATQEIPVTETVAATATIALAAPPSETLIPTSSFTSTLTITPLPTDTRSPFGLIRGQELSDNRVTLKLKEIKYQQGRTRVGQRPRALIVFEFDFINHSGDTIQLDIGPDKFRVEDNLENKLTCDFWNGLGAFETAETIKQALDNGQTIRLGVYCGEGQIPSDVMTYTLYVTDFSSLPDSTWIVEVAR
jgi:hypothetical protein